MKTKKVRGGFSSLYSSFPLFFCGVAMAPGCCFMGGSAGSPPDQHAAASVRPPPSPRESLETRIPWHAEERTWCVRHDAAPNDLQKHRVFQDHERWLGSQVVNDIEGRLVTLNTATLSGTELLGAEIRVGDGWTFTTALPIGPREPAFRQLENLAERSCVVFSARIQGSATVQGTLLAGRAMSGADVRRGVCGHDFAIRLTSIRSCNAVAAVPTQTAAPEEDEEVGANAPTDPVEPDDSLAWQPLNRPWSRIHLNAECDDAAYGELTVRQEMAWHSDPTAPVIAVTTTSADVDGEQGTRWREVAVHARGAAIASIRSELDASCANQQATVVYAGERVDGLLLLSMETLPQRTEGRSRPGHIMRYLFEIQGGAEELVEVARWSGADSDVPQAFRIRAPSGGVVPAAAPAPVAPTTAVPVAARPDVRPQRRGDACRRAMDCCRDFARSFPIERRADAHSLCDQAYSASGRGDWGLDVCERTITLNRQMLASANLAIPATCR